jgi:hypothetical protein
VSIAAQDERAGEIGSYSYGVLSTGSTDARRSTVDHVVSTDGQLVSRGSAWQTLANRFPGAAAGSLDFRP